MRRIITSVVIAVLLGGFTGAAAQLPPEIMADRYLLQAERLMAKKDYEAAMDMMGKIVALQREHDLTLPDEFHAQRPKYVQVARLTQFCGGQPEGAECWMALANQPCSVWNPDFHPNKTMTWTDECAGGLTQGTGTLKWV